MSNLKKHDAGRIKQALYILALAFLLLIPAVLATAADGPLNILLTNDDGWSALGIQTLKEALRDAGHQVTLVAPDGNRSGSSSALTYDLVTVVEQDTDEYSANGTPATCVFIGVQGILFEEPDLIVSGINDRPNLGPSIPFSGTVGATIPPMLVNIPAIAFSTSTDLPAGLSQEAHFSNVANFAVRLIEHLANNPAALSRESGILPKGTGLNVNYPPIPSAYVKGINITVQGRVLPVTLTYTNIPNTNIYFPQEIPTGEQDVTRNSDASAFFSGFITITPIDPNFTASKGLRKALKSTLLKMEP